MVPGLKRRYKHIFVAQFSGLWSRCVISGQVYSVDNELHTPPWSSMYSVVATPACLLECEGLFRLRQPDFLDSFLLVLGLWATEDNEITYFTVCCFKTTEKAVWPRWSKTQQTGEGTYAWEWLNSQQPPAPNALSVASFPASVAIISTPMEDYHGIEIHQKETVLSSPLSQRCSVFAHSSCTFMYGSGITWVNTYGEK